MLIKGKDISGQKRTAQDEKNFSNNYRAINWKDDVKSDEKSCPKISDKKSDFSDKENE